MFVRISIVSGLLPLEQQHKLIFSRFIRIFFSLSLFRHFRLALATVVWVCGHAHLIELLDVTQCESLLFYSVCPDERDHRNIQTHIKNGVHTTNIGTRRVVKKKKNESVLLCECMPERVWDREQQIGEIKKEHREHSENIYRQKCQYCGAYTHDRDQATCNNSRKRSTWLWWIIIIFVCMRFFFFTLHTVWTHFFYFVFPTFCVGVGSFFPICIHAVEQVRQQKNISFFVFFLLSQYDMHTPHWCCMRTGV